MLRTAVIGVGYLGRFHAEKYSLLKDVELVAVVDTDEARAKDIAQKLGCSYSSDYKNLPDNIDAVSIVVPTVNHFEVASFFLSKGIHCLLEKPITTTLEEADILIDTAQKTGALLQVGHIERFNPAVKILSQKVNRPLFIEAHRLSTFKPRAIDVDVILDLMIHDIDIVLHLVKQEVTNIMAVGVPVLTPNVDIANVRLVFKNGCNANLTASRVSRDTMRRIRVFQPGCFIGADCAEKNALIVAKTGQELSEKSLKSRLYKLDNNDALYDEIKSFVSCIKENKQPEVTGIDGRNALSLALTIGEQIQEGLNSLNLDINDLLPPPQDFVKSQST